MCAATTKKHPESIRHLLPRGVISKVSKLAGLSWQAVYYVATGHLDRPDIYNQLLKEAMHVKKNEVPREPLTDENKKLASELEQISKNN